MEIGKLDKRVTLQQPAAGVDEIGQPLTSWDDVAELWADVRYQSGLSAIKAGADVSLSKVRIRLRHRAVNAGQRILHDGTVFAIQAVLPDARRAYVDLVCLVIV